MAVKLNENKEIVQGIKDGLKQTGGYCPCRLERTDATKCICEEFKQQIADPDFEGYCHCLLYYKSRDQLIGEINKQKRAKQIPCSALPQAVRPRSCSTRGILFRPFLSFC